MPEEPIKTYLEKRPWGNFQEFTKNRSTSVKILTVESGEAFSLQTHKMRDEFWRVLSGEGKVVVGEEGFDARPGEEYFIPRGTKHRLKAGQEKLVVLEISLGNFDENDIERLEDKYGRV